MASLRLLPFFALSLLACSSCVAGQGDAACLQALKQSLVDPSGTLHTWVFDGKQDVCHFAGVACTAGRRVYSIVLPGANLRGRLPGGFPSCGALERLVLAGNHLAGGIPADLCLQAPSLRSLDLSGNMLVGVIPESLSLCSSLVELHLQHNGLSGVIPWRMGLMASLALLDVSYNHLSGQIPNTMVSRSQVKQIGFPASSFQGNPGLCGPPLLNACISM